MRWVFGSLAVVLGFACNGLGREVGEWEELIKGEGMEGWKKPTGEWLQVGEATKDAANEKAIATKPGKGILVNGAKGRTGNLFTEGQFGDIEAHIEFMVPRASNSGIYFMGRYEIQVYDSFAVAKDAYPGIECGGIYERWDDKRKPQGFEGHSPRVNASKAPGEWQAFDVVFLAPRFDAQGGDEKAMGPLMFQGDHGPVAYRALRVRPVAAQAVAK